MTEQKDWSAVVKDQEKPPEAPTVENKENLGLDHPSYEALEAKLTEAEVKANDYWNEVLRLKAEMVNVQKRADRDVSSAHRYALEKFASELLAIVDNLERSLMVKIDDNHALKDMYLGVELTLKMFLDVLQKFGITPISPQGETFNPTLHTAMSVEDGPTPNVVLKVIQKGYLLKDRLLRSALVIVTKNS